MQSSNLGRHQAKEEAELTCEAEDRERSLRSEHKPRRCVAFSPMPGPCKLLAFVDCSGFQEASRSCGGRGWARGSRCVCKGRSLGPTLQVQLIASKLHSQHQERQARRGKDRKTSQRIQD